MFMKIYTRTGDGGTTGMFGGERVLKDSLAVESYGSIDELTCVLGVLLTLMSDKKEVLFITNIQKDLYILMGFLAHSPVSLTSCKKNVLEMEKKIDILSEKLPALHSFIIPGGSPASAWAHLARTVCRRAERMVVHLHHQGDKKNSDLLIVIQYLNRLSDLLFTYARFFNTQNESPLKI